MLRPGDRSTLAELLRAPEGYRVDSVVVTTYSLDLIALLALPLSMALSAGEAIGDDGSADTLGLLEAVRGFSGRLHVFHEPGQMGVPRRGHLLLGYLEGALVETRAPRGGAFHPKVSVVRFIPNPVGDREESLDVRYRVLCGTRNLTFDRSWDTVLSLDGAVSTSRARAASRNRPLADFIGRLPALAVRAVSSSTAGAIATIADELLRVDFEVPEGFGTSTEDLAFWPIGIDDKNVWPFNGRLDRMLVVSPFVDRTALARFRRETDVCTVVSRPEELDLVVDASDRDGTDYFVLADAADGEPEDEGAGTQTDTPTETETSIPIEPSAPGLRGLHAKLFVADAGADARVWTGSANATTAAFSRNVEFLVELRGRRSTVGIEALMGADESRDRNDRLVTFRSLLQPYRRLEHAKAVDEVQHRLDEMLESGRRILMEAQLSSVVSEAGANSVQYDVTVEAAVDPGPWPDDVECRLRPLSLPDVDAVAVEGLKNPVASFSGLSFELLTGFSVVELVARYQKRSDSCAFAMVTPLVGAPPDREERLLLAMLSSRARLLRYLLLLLQGPDGLVRTTTKKRGGGWEEESWGWSGEPLLEPLLRRLADDPSKVRAMERLVTDLEATEGGRQLLPDDLRKLWASIRPLLDEASAARGARE